jgi:hypothetical protein
LRKRRPWCGDHGRGKGRRKLGIPTWWVGRIRSLLFFTAGLIVELPEGFCIRVIRRGVDPILCRYYKSSRIKQYFKEGRALRTETVICDTGDFGIGRRVCLQNWNALRAVSQSANRSLCDAEAADAQCAPDVATFCQVSPPSINKEGLYAAALRLGEQRVMAILSALVGFCYLIEVSTIDNWSSALGPFCSHRIPVGRRHTICAA